MRSVHRRSSWGASALVLIAGIALVAPASAQRTPAQLTPTFKDRDRPDGGQKTDSTCSVGFAEIVDERRSPELVGVIGKRSVLAPADSQSWMRAVLRGLNARGVKALFDAAGRPGGPTARFVLKTAWVAESVDTYSAVVVVTVQAQGADGRAVDRTYRGRVARTAYWSGGVDTMQSAVDGAFADALDAIAADLKPLCQS